jgi:NAD(P)-dependent dehydrogenase (short-subunit alcohol dehydrogenase family)
MHIENKTILITGANRGIGRALVEEALRRGAKQVYAATRQPFAHSDERITPLTLDVTNALQIQGAVGSVESLDILVNNAGVDFTMILAIALGSTGISPSTSSVRTA